MKKICALLVLTVGLVGCGLEAKPATPTSSSGVTKAEAVVKTGADGLTVEQRNIAERVKRDNDIGSYKHLYVISAFSGDVIIYSTVKGKVTSSSKRLTPTSVTSQDGQYVGKAHYGQRVQIGDRVHYTSEVIQDDGTYGSSIPYVYWFDSKGVYHQHYVSGGQILHVTDQPMAVGKVIINTEQSQP